MKETAFISFKKYLQSINWVVLIFLVFILNVKLPVKILALLFINLINRKKLFNKQILSQGIIVFYFSMIFLVIIYLLLHILSVTFPYLVAATMSAGLWFMSALAAYHIFIFTNEEDTKKLHNTLMLFFILNIVVISFSFLLVVFEAGAINPFEYTGLNQKFYVSTGDFLRGITFENPVTTAIICAFGILYFLYQQKFLLSLLNMIGFLLMGSNMTNVVLLIILLFIFCLKSDKIQKSIIVVLIMLMAVFMFKISPHNFEYSGRWVYKLFGKEYNLPKATISSLASLKNKPDNILNFEEKRQKHALLYIDSISEVNKQKGVLRHEKTQVKIKEIQEPKKDSLFYIYKEPIVLVKKTNNYRSFVNKFYTGSDTTNILKSVDYWDKSGKLVGFLQLRDFYKKNPEKIWMGDGPANFSSRVAFKTTALNIAGAYPEKLRYINPDFKNNHLYVYLYYRLQDEVKHSAINIPDSVYVQLLSEYGITGVLCFIVFYLGYFVKRIRYLTYGVPMLLFMGATFFFEYWFETLSIVILFEFMLLINIKESANINGK
jgi:hypothetical protein